MSHLIVLIVVIAPRCNTTAMSRELSEKVLTGSYHLVSTLTTEL